jgi:hypothetical protein
MNFGMFQKPRLSNGVRHREFRISGGDTPGVLRTTGVYLKHT